MRKNNKSSCFTLLCFVVLIMFCSSACGAADQPADPESVQISKSEYDTMVTEIEQLKAENQKQKAEIAEYETYSDVIQPLKDEDYNEAIKAVAGRASSVENTPEDNSTDISEQDLIGIWISSKDTNCSFELKENGQGTVGNTACTWILNSNAYGPTGITIYVDDGKGSYGLTFHNTNPIVMWGNSYTPNMPDYVDIDSFAGCLFSKQ